MRLLAAALLPLALAACHVTGPASIRRGRDNYNVAIQQTNNEQLLLNLVRLRYRDTPLFLEIASITSNFTFELGGGANGGLSTSKVHTVGLSSSVGYAERPTVSYVPLQGQRFATQLLSPIAPRIILLMYHSGWAIDRIFRICVQHLGPLHNATRASGPTPDTPPEYDGFFEATDLLRTLWQRGHLDMGFLADDSDTLALRIDDEGLGSPEFRRLVDLLGLRVSSPLIILSDREPGGVALVPRSVLAAMFYLSQGVEVPERDRRANRVTITRTLEGLEFDWSRITGGLMRIQSRRSAPPGAYVAIPYRDAWFYIDDADLASKSTFTMLAQLLELQSGEIKAAGPVLTIPVN
jgi:hypothetical protein